LPPGQFGERPECFAQSPDLDAQPCAMGFVGLPRPEGAGEQRFPRHITGPGFRERAGEREQHRPTRKRNHRNVAAHDLAAGIEYERTRRQQRFDFSEPEQPVSLAQYQARGGGIERARRAVDFRYHGRNSRLTRRVHGPVKRSARRLRLDTPDRYPGSHEPEPGTRRRWQHIEIEAIKGRFSRVEPADQEEPPGCEIAGMCGIGPIAMRLERRLRRVKRLHGSAEVAQNERNLGPGDDTSGAGNGLLRAERARRALQQLACACQVAELRHCDAAQCQRRGIITQCDPFQCGERIARCKRARSGGDQRVHSNPVKLVTLTPPASDHRYLLSSTAATNCQMQSGARP